MAAGVVESPLENLMNRFGDELERDVVRDVLVQHKGHAGRAARQLRELSEADARAQLLQRPRRGDDEKERQRCRRRGTEPPPQMIWHAAGRQAATATSASAPAPASTRHGRLRKLDGGKALALQRSGANNDARVLVRAVRELYRYAAAPAPAASCSCSQPQLQTPRAP
eukprot:COSAG01_NODE_838_length_13194_cov_9.063240_2_plen_168_part_00